MKLALSQYDVKAKSNAGQPMVIKHPETGDPTESIIYFRGVDSDEWTKLNRIRLNKAFLAASNNTQDEIFSEDSQLVMLKSLATGWENVFWEDDEPLDFTPENFEKVINVPEIREQAISFVNDRSNFRGGSRTVSKTG